MTTQDAKLDSLARKRDKAAELGKLALMMTYQMEIDAILAGVPYGLGESTGLDTDALAAAAKESKRLQEDSTLSRPRPAG